MIAIRRGKNPDRIKPRFTVCYGVMEEYAKFNADGTFSGPAGISCHAISRAFETLTEAQEAEKAFREYTEKYR